MSTKNSFCHRTYRNMKVFKRQGKFYLLVCIIDSFFTSHVYKSIMLLSYDTFLALERF